MTAEPSRRDELIQQLRDGKAFGASQDEALVDVILAAIEPLKQEQERMEADRLLFAEFPNDLAQVLIEALRAHLEHVRGAH